MGWTWTLAGLVIGALIAPTFVQMVGLSDTAYQDWLVIAVAVLAGFLVQLLGWVLLAILVLVSRYEDGEISAPLWGALFLVITLPLAGVSYGIYRYLSWVSAGQRIITFAFVGALLIKTFAIPLIKGIVTGTLLRWVVRVLGGGKDKGKS